MIIILEMKLPTLWSDKLKLTTTMVYSKTLLFAEYKVPILNITRFNQI